MALDPDRLRRRQRRPQKRGTERTLGEKGAGLGLLSADEKLEVLLEKLLVEAKLDTLFTMTLERDRLFSALFYAGFVAPLWVNTEIQLAPLALVTTISAVPAGLVFVPREHTVYNSIPWALSVSYWIDSGPPAMPQFVMLRFPDTYRFRFGGIIPIRRFLQATTLNTDLINTLNVASINEVAVMSTAVWEMLEKIYLEPIAEYAQEKAEELTGRPWP